MIKTLWRLSSEIEKAQPKRVVHSSLDFAPKEINLEPKSSIDNFTKQDLESQTNYLAEGGENIIDLSRLDEPVILSESPNLEMREFNRLINMKIFKHAHDRLSLR